MIAALLALTLAAAPQADAPPPPPPPEPEVIFARGSRGSWSMEGRTVIVLGSPETPDFSATEPTIRDMFCLARRNGIKVSVLREGGLDLEIEAGIIENGRERRLSAVDLRALLLDGAAWEVKTRSESEFSGRLADVVYPDREPESAATTDRHLAVRRPPGNVWLPLGTLADDLLRARMLRLGFREEVRDPDAGEEDPMVWIDVPLDGLAGALSWCQRAMASPNALRLHPPGIEQPPAPIRR
ncbi:MAG TPA: hypothetical protein VMS43_16750 [Allosphingosinicella sp.]|nr:hypothetical protein [Allosphingosinicella sp.]